MMPARSPLSPLIALLAALLLGACGGGDSPSGGPRVSAVLLSTYPHAATTGDFGSYVWAASYEASTVHFYSSSQTVSSSGDRVMAVATIVDGGVKYLLVSSIDSGGIFILDRFHDSNDDGIPDQSTRTTLISGGSTQRYATAIYARSRSEMYLYDARQGDILIALGSGGNWVSGVRSAPYAAYADYPQLQTTHRLMDGTSSTGVFGILASPTVGGESASLLQESPLLLFPDANNDRYADSVSAQSSDIQPIIEGPRPFAGQTTLVVRRVGSTATKVVEVWSINPTTYADISSLGSVSMSSTEATKDVTLSTALSSGDAIAVRYQGSSAAQRTIYSVEAAWPQVMSPSPAVIPANTATSVTFTGVNFSSNMTLKMMQHRTDAQSLSFTFNSSTSVTATIPASAALSVLSVYALGSGQDDADAVGSARVCVSNN